MHAVVGNGGDLVGTLTDWADNDCDRAGRLVHADPSDVAN
jgi:hypothetical protein